MFDLSTALLGINNKKNNSTYVELLWYSFEVEVKDQSLVDVKLFFHQFFFLAEPTVSSVTWVNCGACFAFSSNLHIFFPFFKHDSTIENCSTIKQLH